MNFIAATNVFLSCGAVMAKLIVTMEMMKITAFNALTKCLSVGMEVVLNIQKCVMELKVVIMEKMKVRVSKIKNT